MRRVVVLGCTAMLLAGAASAQAVAEGEWINLFDGETTYGWVNFGDVAWEVSDGAIEAEEGWSGLLATTSQFADFELHVTLQLDRQGTAGVLFRSPLTGHPVDTGGNMIYIECDERTGCDEQQVVVRAVGDNVEATVDGEPVELTTERRIGHIGIAFHRYHSQGRGQELSIKEVKLRPLQLTPLFDGETLDGWNILPGRNSEFSVDDGALRIVNGNGQIETEGVYQDFLLQLDVYSNGEALNSGVFFRGPVGEFWRGYESQVRNEWRGDDRTLPVDYGTGGLYGLDPARKVVSSDFEWFNKTIVANGNHFAVWVNGYLVADYVDTRPVHPQSDAKNGFVPHAGTIHLQGHDPLTDLSFKDINIQEYPDN